MLNLDSPRWSELQHAYGSAADIPGRLRELRDMPEAKGDSEPWFGLWSALAHQGDVFPASFAALPHVVDALAGQPHKASASYFQFHAWIEICRQRAGSTVPDDLAPAYFAAIARLPALAAAAAAEPWDEDMLACVLSAVAVAKGDARVAEAALELSAEGADAYLRWLEDR